jgi:hypothetical protein
MTKEDYLAKMKNNYEKKEREYLKVYHRKEKEFVNQVIKRIVERIENANPQQIYILSKEETKWLSTSILFKEKLDELRKKYDFLDIYTNTYKCLGYPNEIRNIRWRVKGE